MFSDTFIHHLAQLVAFDRLWAALIEKAINLPANDDVKTCTMMRDESRSEAAYDACSFKDTSFTEHLFGMEFSFPKTIVAVNVIFPTPKMQEYHATVMKDLDGTSFYIRQGPLVFFNEIAVRDVGVHLTRSISSGRTFPT